MTRNTHEINNLWHFIWREAPTLFSEREDHSPPSWPPNLTSFNSVYQQYLNMCLNTNILLHLFANHEMFNNISLCHAWKHCSITQKWQWTWEWMLSLSWTHSKLCLPSSPQLLAHLPSLRLLFRRTCTPEKPENEKDKPRDTTLLKFEYEYKILIHVQ